MSHAFLIALLPANTEPGEIEAKLEALMAPYSESMKLPERPVPCYCVGDQARMRARKEAHEKVGGIDKIRDAFHADMQARGLDVFGEEADEEWEQRIAPLEEAEAAALAGDPGKDKPDPACEECKGSGSRLSSYNPHSKWDWYVIGGRFDGCVQSKQRDDGDKGFNFGPAHHELQNNTLWPAGKLLPFTKDNKPYAVMTPGGVWYEKGRLGWFGVVIDPLKKEEWEQSAAALVEAHKDCIAVGVDYHI